MKHFSYCALCAIVGFSLFSPRANAKTYICPHEKKPIYTTVHLNQACTPSQMDGISEAPAAPIESPNSPVTAESALKNTTVASVPQMIDDEINRIWTKTQWESFDNTPILPPSDVVPETIIKAHVRKTSPPVAHVVPTTIVSQPAPLTRRQLLQQELQREQAALNHAKTQLAHAYRTKDAAAARRFYAQVQDRKLNIQALQEEMVR